MGLCRFRAAGGLLRLVCRRLLCGRRGGLLGRFCGFFLGGRLEGRLWARPVSGQGAQVVEGVLALVGRALGRVGGVGLALGVEELHHGFQAREQLFGGGQLDTEDLETLDHAGKGAVEVEGVIFGVVAEDVEQVVRGAKALQVGGQVLEVQMEAQGGGGALVQLEDGDERRIGGGAGLLDG